jgi:hypothetical protein
MQAQANVIHEKRKLEEYISKKAKYAVPLPCSPALLFG